VMRDCAFETSRRIHQPATPDDSDRAAIPRNAMNSRAPMPSRENSLLLLTLPDLPP
jgi:hypothetical protein